MNALIKLAAFAVVLELSSSSIVKSPSTNGDTFELLILHNNDMHARFEQTSQLSGTCTTEDREAGKCYGGFPRVAYVVKEARRKAATGEGPPVLYLNAGDTYTGTAWFTIYKWKIAAEFINALQPDAVSLGNNEVEPGATEFSQLINNINTPILSSNVLFKNVHSKNLKASVVFDIQGRKVGVVGYLKPENRILDSAGKVEYIDEVLALKEEVTKLQNLGVNIIIALGHTDFERDIEIARDVKGVDIVIGGHKNMYYWNGTNAENLSREMKIITQDSGKKVLVVQSYAYNTYLGRFSVEFDKNGDVLKYVSKPILLDNTVPQDPESLKIHELNTKNAALLSEEIVGQTSVVLDGQSCRNEECNLGNLVTDSMMYYYATRFEGETWTDAPIAIIHGGAIAGSIAPANRPASVTRGDLYTALPVASNLIVVTMNGDVLVEVLEHGVANYDPSNPSEQFLQFSGVRIVYDLANEPGSRIVSAVVRCWSCVVPSFFVIDSWRDYKIIMPQSLLDAQYGYSMLNNLPRQELAYDEVTCLAEYIKLRSPVYPDVAGRIVLQNIPDVPDVTEEPATTDTPTITDEPVTDGPVTDGPVTDGPVTDGPVTDGPVTDGPVTDGPVTDGPVTDGPVTDGPVTDGPVTDGPVTDGPVTDGPVTDGPVTDGPVTDGPVTDGPVTDGPVTDGPITDSPVTDLPTTTDAPDEPDSAAMLSSSIIIIALAALPRIVA